MKRISVCFKILIGFLCRGEYIYYIVDSGTKSGFKVKEEAKIRERQIRKIILHKIWKG